MLAEYYGMPSLSMFLSNSLAVVSVIFSWLLAGVATRRPKGKSLSLHHKTTLGVCLLAKTAARVVENSNAAATIEAVDANADCSFAWSIEIG